MKRTLACFKRKRVDLGLGLLLFISALIVRIPNLYLIPRFTDEVLEWMFAFEIGNGQHPIWQGVTAYFGPLEPDLLALALHFFPNPYLPRALALVASALTVPATFALASVVGGRRAGVIAAVLMAVSSTQIVANSHVAYNNSLTPLLIAIALTLFYVAKQRQSGWFLAGAGLTFGFAAHTHPIALTILPGMAIWFLLPRSQWQWFRRPAFFLAIGAALLAYAPVLAGILWSFSSFASQVTSRNYAFAPVQSLNDYLVNLQAMLVEVARMVGAVYPNLHAPRDYIAQPLVSGYLLLALVALVSMIRLRSGFFIAAIAAPLLCTPLFNAQYGDFPYFTRYVALLLPPFYGAIGLGASTMWQRISARFSEPPHQNTLARGGLALLACIGLGWLVLTPLVLTSQFYATQVNGNRTNTPLLEVIQEIDQEPKDRIWLDPKLRAGEFPSGGSALFVFQMWFELTRRKSQDAKPRLICKQGTAWLIATDSFGQQVAKRCRIQQVSSQTIATRPGFETLHFGLYRVP